MDTFGSCHDTLTACQGCRQASDASRIFTALIESALADSPHFRYQLRLGLAVICRYLTASSPCYRAGAAGVLRRHGVEKTTPPVGLVLPLTAQFERAPVPDSAGEPRLLPQVAELLAARPEFELVGLPSQHGLKYIWSMAIRKELNRGRHSSFCMSCPLGLHHQVSIPWLPSYFAASCDGASGNTLKGYIEQQKKPR